MSFSQQVESEPRRFKNTLGLYFLFTCHGLVLGIIGPTMLDLSIACETDISSVIHINTGRAGGLLLGSFMTAFIYTHLDVPALLAFGTLISAFIVLAIPFVQNVYLLIGIFFILGCNMGAFESAATVFLIDLWGTENGPFMRLVHFFFGFGAFISPLLSVAFLVEEESTDQWIGNTSHAINSVANETDTHQIKDDLMLIYPYTIISLMMIITAVSLLIIRLFYNETEPHPSRMQHLTLCPTHGIGELYTDIVNADEVQSCKIIHPDVSRIVNAHVEKVPHVNATSPTCAKCNRLRRFTFSNNGNALSIVSNSSMRKSKMNKISEEATSHFNGQIASFVSPMSSPIASPLAGRHFTKIYPRSSSVTSDCSQCEPKIDLTPVKSRQVSHYKVMESTEDKCNENTIHDTTETFKIIVIVLCAFFLHFYCGLTSFGTLVSPFAINSALRMSKRVAAIVSSLYWGAFAFSRLFMFFFISIIDTKNWILLNVFLCLLSNVFLVPFSGQYAWALWIGSMIMGIGLNAIWMSILGYIEQFIPLTSKIMAMFTCSAYIGQILVPTIVSPFLEAQPIVLMWISLAYSLAMLALLTAIIYLCGHKLSSSNPSDSKPSDHH